jgi:hypothetical protein
MDFSHHTGFRYTAAAILSRARQGTTVEISVPSVGWMPILPMLAFFGLSIVCFGSRMKYVCILSNS